MVHLFDTGDSSFRDEIVEMPAKRAKDGMFNLSISEETFIQHSDKTDS